MSQTHAVVIGGSMAGLCTARILSTHFDSVTILDRDTCPDGVRERAGVPHGRHVHALLVRGRQELNRLFPGFDTLMLERGAHEIDFGNDFATLRNWGWEPRRPTGLLTLFASRHLIESTVRELCCQLPNVEVRDQTSATGLGMTPSGSSHPSRIDAVHIVPRDRGASASMPADLVVDASGRTSKAPDWLQALGIAPPPETIVNAHSGYSSRWYQAPPAAQLPKEWWWKGIWLDLAWPEHPLGGVLFPVEHSRWIVTLAGVSKHYPPKDDEEFTAALSQLRSPVLADAVRLAEPLSPVYAYRKMANRFRRYERWKTGVNGFIAVGDSVCAFNPVYGQGMTTGTLSAGVLDECLNEYGPTHPDLSRHFFTAQARVQAAPWGLATGADFSLPGTEGERPRGARIAGPYLKALSTAAIEDMTLRRHIGEVLQMLKPPSSFFTPAVMGRVAKGTLQRWRRHQSEQPAPPAMPPTPMPVV